MIIKEITSQHRRDFVCIYQCDHCGFEKKGNGYDDANFHQNVIPSMKCPKCDQKAKNDYIPNDTKYPQGYTI